MLKSPPRVSGTWPICIAICAITCAAYSPIFHNGFVNYDDPEYVTDNAMVKFGVTWEGVRWAFGSSHAFNWHPLTWISHMLDCQFFGLNATAHHITNLVLHLFNTLLLFALFKRMTGFLWRSAILATLFALHPMHVESVAWVAERKDVLSTFFGLLSTWFYVRFASGEPKAFNYGIALIFFAASLLSKGMLVTLPFVWLLLDWYLLKRVSAAPLKETTKARNKQTAGSSKRIGSLIIEKLPFFGLSALVSFITYSAQAKAIIPGQKYFVLLKVLLCIGSYWRYLLKLICPVNLAVLYPLPREYHLWQHGILALALIGISIWAFRCAPRRAWLALGWFWFLGTLVPVIGIVKVGVHSIADRYTYFPSIGFFLLLVWAAAWVVQRFNISRLITSATIVLMLGVLVFATVKQTLYWRSSQSLFERAIAVTDKNAVAHENLAQAFTTEKEWDRAVKELKIAIELAPETASAHNSLGAVYLRLNRTTEAEEEFAEAIHLDSSHARTYSNLSELFLKRGELDKGLAASLTALKLRPDLASALYNAGTAYSLRGKPDEAIAYFERAVEVQPDLTDAHYNLACVLAEKERLAEAEAHYRKAIELDSRHVNATYNLGNLLLKQNRLADAGKTFQKILQIEPEMPEPYYQLGVIAMQQRQYALAVSNWREALRRKPVWTEPLNNLSWLLSTCSDASIRDGREALKLARALETFTGNRNPDTLDTMATAFAETAEFGEAVTYEQGAIDLLKVSKEDGRLPSFQKRLDLFKAGKPYRE